MVLGIYERIARRLIAFVVLLISSAWMVTDSLTQQVSDPNFNARVPQPAYRRNHPKVLFDEAHHNFHTAGGRYKAFADLVTSDGYRITPNRTAFSKDLLRRYDILIIANALGAEIMTDPKASGPAFTEDECDAVRDWVTRGGKLLLITDHQPTGAAASNLAKRFGVTLSNSTIMDPAESNHLKGYFEVNLEFTHENRLLLHHPITDGRDARERINRVVTFGGQAIKGPPGSVGFLKLGPSAVNASSRKLSAAGEFQALAMKFGAGRLVVTGEAGMLSAQLVAEEDGKPPSSPWGMNFPGIDNRQLALNIMHWLSGRLK